MKRSFIFLVAVVFTLLFSCGKDGNWHYPLSQEDALEKTRSLWENYDLVLVSKDIVPAGTQTEDRSGSFVICESDSWLIVADTKVWSFAIGEAKFLYIVVNKNNGRVSQSYHSSAPVSVIAFDHIIEPPIDWQASPNTTEPSCSNYSSHANDPCLDPVLNNKWAIIINGGYNSDNNLLCCYNDCVNIYKLLTQDYGYPRSHIYVIMSDGTDPGYDLCLPNGYTINTNTDLDGDGNGDVQYSATLSNVQTVFSTVTALASDGDDVFIQISDHGGTSGGYNTFAYLWGNDILTDATFAGLINNFRSGVRLHILLGQCYSGGFLDNISRVNTSIATSSRYDEQSYATALYSRFVNQWLAAVKPTSAYNTDIDKDDDGFISLYEAYSRAQDIILQTNQIDNTQHPQFKSLSSNFGRHFNLAGHYSLVPELFGDENVTSSQNTYFSLSELPADAVVAWYLGMYNESYLGSGSSQSFSNTFSDLPYETRPLKVYITRSGGGSYDPITKGLFLWKPGNHFNPSLIQDNGIEFSLWENPIGATNFIWASDDPYMTIWQTGAYFAGYEMAPGMSPAYSQVWVSFYNPFGESTTVIRINPE